MHTNKLRVELVADYRTSLHVYKLLGKRFDTYLQFVNPLKCNNVR